jgi:corrinoid protein of di/trimethylamine methyltransferase
MAEELLTQIAAGLIDGDPDAAVELTRQALAAGLDPLVVIEQALTPGMNTVGERFGSGEFFLPQLVVAARGMQLAMDVLEPELLARRQTPRSAGTVVIGTVKGDIHEIGKSLVATMLAANGFQVHDLGVDVAAEAFVARVKETGASILALSALLTTTMTVQREVIEALEAAGIRPQVKVMVGGAPVNQAWANAIGADGYAEDAVGAVALAKRLAG